MSEDKYIAIIPIIIELFEKCDAEVIEIGKPPIKITRRYFEKIASNDVSLQNPNIQIINNLSSSITVENKTIINNIIGHLEDEGLENSEIKEIRRKLGQLDKELKKSKPSWVKIKETLSWALDSKDVFIQLIPLLLKMSL